MSTISPKILIGTPIHVSKQYAVPRWIEAVNNLDYPVDELLLVDNSPDMEYVDYLKTIIPPKIKTSIIHIDIHQHDGEERVAIAREEIRKKVLSEGFDWWFSWECDTIAPPNILHGLLSFSDRFKLIHHMSPSRHDPNHTENIFGLSLVHRDLLEKYGFIISPGIPATGQIDPDMPHCWHGTCAWFNKRVLKGNDPYIQIYGLINPLEHLNGY